MTSNIFDTMAIIFLVCIGLFFLGLALQKIAWYFRDKEMWANGFYWYRCNGWTAIAKIGFYLAVVGGTGFLIVGAAIGLASRYTSS